ncbi:hypothetical protein [Rhizobium sp. NZLR4b]|uniref:hypothetical protein n=1 Tax=Rhizobium sp. NZLR4b TaxID=2731102 RepID=UPI001C83A416|nr:hypothetical protein [Rhizobium sp. NZLR4b]MBX5164792.1 hypothetical protein [Rhizobium sp. NZLR4b]
MDLFSVNPKEVNYETHPLDRETALPYAQKFWEAGNQVVLLIYAAAFGFYIALSQREDLSSIAIQHRFELIAIAIFGNAALIYLLWRMACHEYRLTRTYTTNPLLADAIWSALHMRIGLVVVNLSLYLYVLLKVLE